MTPDYYRTTDASDLYDLWRQHYGTETACRHLEMIAQEYLYRAPEKGSYLADLAKVQTIVQRLLAWGESPEGQAESQACDTREPLLTREQLLWQLQEEGYGLVRPADPTQPDPPQPALVSHAELTQRMPQAIDHRDEALAALASYTEAESLQNGAPYELPREIDVDEDAIEQAFWEFDARGKRTGAPRDAFKGQMRLMIRQHLRKMLALLQEAEIYVRAYKCQCDAPEGIPGASRLLKRLSAYPLMSLHRPWPAEEEPPTTTTETGTHAPYPETVLQHCVDADYARQGVAVEAEIRALLTHYRIPADSPYGDWSSELVKHEPQRWPDVAAQEVEP